MRHEHGIDLASLALFSDLDALVYAVAHDHYSSLDNDVSGRIAPNGMVLEVRSKIDPATLRHDIRYWSL